MVDRAGAGGTARAVAHRRGAVRAAGPLRLLWTRAVGLFRQGEPGRRRVLLLAVPAAAHGLFAAARRWRSGDNIPGPDGVDIARGLDARPGVRSARADSPASARR